jgi:signal transduction histidine kinase
MLPNERTTRNEVAATPGEVEGLVVAPNRNSARPLVEFLRAEGVNVQVVSSAEQGFEEALLHRPNVVLIDETITGAGGVDLCERLKANARTHFLPTILFSQNKQSDLLRLDALAAGADAMFCPSTTKEERRARLWALLRSQAIFRKIENKQLAQGTAMRNKRRWVRGLVHDVQNSLGALQANFEYMTHELERQGAKKRDELAECIQDTRSTFRELVRNLRTVLEYERFEAGDVVLRKGKVLLSEVTESVRSSLEHLAANAHKEIVVESAAFALPVQGDEVYVREAVSNLAAYTLRQADNQKCFLCSSSEGGISRLRVYGDKYKIPPEIGQHIFDPFSGSREDKATKVAHGVGPALAKAIVEAHHGSIWVEDTPDAGSGFVLEFPSHWRSRGQRSSE